MPKRTPAPTPLTKSVSCFPLAVQGLFGPLCAAALTYGFRMGAQYGKAEQYGRAIKKPATVAGGIDNSPAVGYTKHRRGHYR